MKETFGAEVADQLLVALRRYEEEDGYEGLITSAVGLLTQRDEGLLLLQGQTHALSSDSPRRRLTQKNRTLICYYAMTIDMYITVLNIGGKCVF